MFFVTIRERAKGLLGNRGRKCRRIADNDHLHFSPDLGGVGMPVKSIQTRDSSAGSNLPANGWVVPRVTFHGPQVGNAGVSQAGDPEIMTGKEAARMLRITTKVFLTLLDPQLTANPIPHLLLPKALQIEDRVRIREDELLRWFERECRQVKPPTDSS